MAKNILFFVHGIGQHKEGSIAAAGGPVAALEAAMQRYPACFPAGAKLTDYLDVVEICYDDIFDLILDTWQDLGQSIPASAGFDWVGAVSSLWQSTNGKKDLFLRFGGDVLLYCGFELVARTARLRINSVVATKIYQTWLPAGSSPGRIPRFALIAHSLGTTVAQDALYQLATARWDDDIAEVEAAKPELLENLNVAPESRTDFDAVVAGARQNPDKPIPVGLSALYLVSNTIPLLRQAPGEYALLKNDGAFDCARVYNINHAWDPVSRVGGGSANPTPRPGWTNITIRHVHQKNIHALSHYLANPAVHGPIFARLIDPGFSTACVQSAAAAAQTPEWTGFGGPFAALTQEARQLMENGLRGLVTGETSIPALRAAIEGLISQFGEA